MKDNIDWDLKTKQILGKIRIWWNVLDLLSNKWTHLNPIYTKILVIMHEFRKISAKPQYVEAAVI